MAKYKIEIVIEAESVQPTDVLSKIFSMAVIEMLDDVEKQVVGLSTFVSRLSVRRNLR